MLQFIFINNNYKINIVINNNLLFEIIKLYVGLPIKKCLLDKFTNFQELIIAKMYT